MTIGIDASRANIRERTGTEWYSYSLIDEWAKNNAFQGHTVRLYVRERLISDFPKIPSHWQVKILSWRPGIFWTQLRLSLELFFNRVDCLFVPSHAIPFFHPRVTVTTVHDVGFEVERKLYANDSVDRMSTSGRQRIIHTLVRLFTFGKYGASELDYHRFSTRYALRHASTILTVSEFTKNEIQRLYESYPPIEIAYNGINHGNFYFPYPKELITAAKKKYALNDYLFVLGRVEKKKNSLEVVRSYHAYRVLGGNEHLVFAGGKGLGCDEVVSYVKENNLDDSVHFLNWIPQEDIAPLLAGAKLFLFFSHYEGFGVPLIQALAVGTPVLCSKLDVFKEIGGDAITVCDPGENEKTAHVIKNVLSRNETEAKEYKLRGLQRSKRFSWSKSAHKIEKILLNTSSLA